MGGFYRLFAHLVEANGLSQAEIHTAKRVVTLPGFFRPTKTWDVLVMSDNRLVAAIELKSHVGPSFGNNFNNRAEEAIGSAVDLWTAYREGAFGDVVRPFVGWLMLLEDCAGSARPVRDSSPHYPVFDEFKGASYAARYEILCKKLMQENLYSSATILLSERSAAKTGAYSELSELTGIRTFATQFAAHVAAEASRSA